MFTGLIEEVGTVKGIGRRPDGLDFEIRSSRILEGTAVGDSIAVNGACLTVTTLSADGFTAFASRVTCEVTTLGSFARGRRVHLERALSLSSRLGGHLVQAHVDGRGAVSSVKRDSSGIGVVVDAPGEIMRHIVPRGSVAVDGVSLTVTGAEASSFTIYLIPETISNTLLGELASGDEVNIETDVLAKYVERALTQRRDGGKNGDESLLKKLAEGGFM